MCIDFTTDFIGLPAFQIRKWEKTSSTEWVAYLEPYPACYLCPICTGPSQNHARSTHRKLRHRFIPSFGTVSISIPVYRQRCSRCHCTWTVEWEDIPSKGISTYSYQRMSVEMCKNRDLQSVSKQLGVAYTTLERWYYQLASQQLANPKQHTAPEMVCLDEFALRKGHKYGLNLMDAKTGHVWQVTEGKSREKIQQALHQWPFSTAPKVVVTDLAPGMADTVRQVWRQATIVADKFHVIQLFSKYLEAARKRTQFQGTHRRGRHEQRLLHTEPQHLKEEEKIELKKWLKHDRHLKCLYESLQEFRTVYKTQESDGRNALAAWIQKYLFCNTPAVQSIAKTIQQWQQEIGNYFTYRVTNARIEGTHNKIKVIKRRAFGYRNMERFVTRIRLECKAS